MFSPCVQICPLLCPHTAQMLYVSKQQSELRLTNETPSLQPPYTATHQHRLCHHLFHQPVMDVAVGMVMVLTLSQFSSISTPPAVENDTYRGSGRASPSQQHVVSHGNEPREAALVVLLLVCEASPLICRVQLHTADTHPSHTHRGRCHMWIRRANTVPKKAPHPVPVAPSRAHTHTHLNVQAV